MQGWEPETVTEYVYESGRLVRSVTRREVEWDAEQLALVLAHLELENDVGPHGQPMSEVGGAFDVKSGANPDSAYWYRASGPVIDYAEKARVEAREAYEKSLGKDEHVPPWVHFGVTRVERPKRAS